MTFATLLLAALLASRSADAYTPVRVFNNHTKDITVELKGEGLGGCGDGAQPIAPGETDDGDCECLWGTLNYHFYALDNLHTSKAYPLCSTTGIGNCYHTGGYTCTVTSEGSESASCSCRED